MKRSWWWRWRRWWHMKWRGLDAAAAEDLMDGIDLGDRDITCPPRRAGEKHPWEPPNDYVRPVGGTSTSPPCPPSARSRCADRKIRTVPQRGARRDLLGPTFPRMVCLIGTDTGAIAEREALAGKIVFSRCRQLSLPTHDSIERLDGSLLRMIDLADEVLLLNLGGVISFKAANALAYALGWKKPVRTLEPLDLEAWLAERTRQMNATAMPATARRGEPGRNLEP